MDDFLYDNGEGSFLVSYRKALSHHMPISHFHSTYEIFYLMSGNREFFIKDRTMQIDEGDVIIISPNILHRTINAAMPKHERLIVNISESYMAAVNRSYMELLQPLLSKEYMVIKCSLHDQLSIKSLSHQIMQEMQDQKPGFEMYMQTLVIQLLIICCRHVRQDSKGHWESPSLMHETISNIVKYINSHYGQELSLHLLAEKFYVSPYYLSRTFKEATGFTFVEYLNSVRVKEAKKLLEQSGMKVGMIAAKVGFGSVTHFGRVFKSVTGYVPLHYRKGKS
ncbi:AraC family transcriptional regulator [Paenibacillus sp. 2TAB19]|uniref:AraC family transcriptional regulator n=1 Tax=Paenibacillus sp. 2TAB19 TaxID=3233003 RepID=UPI003F99D02B